MEENTEKKKGKVGKVFAIILATIFILVAVLSIIGYVYLQTYGLNEEENMNAIRKQNQEAFMRFDEPFEYGDTITCQDLLNKLLDTSKLADGTIVTMSIEGKALSTKDSYTFDAVGTIPVQITLSYSYEYTAIVKQVKVLENAKDLLLVVEDTKLPVLSGIENKEITIGDDFNPSAGITAEDEIDGNLEVKIEGSVDNTKAGEYILKATATDKSGNVAEQTYTVTVKEKAPTNKTETTDNKTNINTNKTNTTNSNKNTNSSTKEGRLKLSTVEIKRVVEQITNSSIRSRSKDKSHLQLFT